MLYSIINKTRTVMGARLLRHRLYNPMTESNKIEEKYDQVSKLKSSSDIQDTLQNVPDLARIVKKLSMGLLTRNELLSLYECVKILATSLEFKLFTQGQLDFLKVVEYVEYLQETLNESMSDCIFKKDVYQELDDFYKLSTGIDDELIEFLESIKKELGIDLKGKELLEKVKINDGIQTTPVRAAKIKEKHKGIHILSKGKAISVVYNSKVLELLSTRHDLKKEIEATTHKYLQSYQFNMYTRFHDLLQDIINQVSEWDVLQCSWTIADYFKLSRPILDTERSIECKNLRHLVIEHINEGTEYITNDVHLCTASIGLVLYGANACGKTSLLKALGLAVIMAQAGLFVPCSSMKFKPFKQIMTRIAGGDNISKSQSSYIVELEEMFSIETRSNADSLVLGDEMCRGTDTESAVGMCYSLMVGLATRGVTFVAATHLHDLFSEKRPIIPKIQVSHMETFYDKDGNCIFNRKLKPGSGSKMYGIEIAASYGFSMEFIERATKYRNEYVWDKSKKPLKSRFNSKKIKVKCQICGYEPKDNMSLPLDTHHKNFQCNAIQGYHNTQPKDVLHNLIDLCKECHIKVHKFELKIEYQQTLGKTLIKINN
jgi:DNA mismatch repair protein MutS